MIDATHDPNLKSWVESANTPRHDFPIQNLPFGVFRKKGEGSAHLGVAIGDQILDVGSAFGVHSIMDIPAAARNQLRHQISNLLAKRTQGCEQLLIPMSIVEMLLPCRIGDYTDFYASIHHATNVGRLFRPDSPLLPNYKWIPIAYHGRSSSVVVSGTDIRRPQGQILGQREPTYAPTERLDYELELGAFLGPGNSMGRPISIDEAPEHLVGICLLNDWSARDIQSWEYQPLGPFLAKNFATSISPWIVTREALEPFRRPVAPRPEGDPEPLPHLATSTGAYGITVQAWLMTSRSDRLVQLSEADFSNLYWTFSQMIAHHTSNGCPIRPGDLIGSGTISGPEDGNRGCLLEITSGGREPIELTNGETRTFLEDGDEIVLRGFCEGDGYRRIGLGECRGRILTSAYPGK
jgi:fumarylacetoacetase